MKLMALAIAAIHGMIVVGLLALLEAIVQAFNAQWTLPFSIWWGLVFCLPGIAMAIFAAKHRL